VLDSKRSCHVTIHSLMLLMKGSILYSEQPYEHDEISDFHPYLEGFASNVIPWLDKFAALGDPLRCVVGKELVFCFLAPITVQSATSISDSDLENLSLAQLIAQVRKTNEIPTKVNEFSLLVGLGATLPVCDDLINLFLQVRNTDAEDGSV
jgi:hypothetical protein